MLSHFGTKCPKLPAQNVDSITAKSGRGVKRYAPPQNCFEKPLFHAGFRGANCQHPSPAFSSCAPAAAGGAPPVSRLRSNSAAVYLSEQAARSTHKAASPEPGLVVQGQPPASDRLAVPPPGSTGNKRLSSFSPTYSTRSPTAGSHIPGHNWRTSP